MKCLSTTSSKCVKGTINCLMLNSLNAEYLFQVRLFSPVSGDHIFGMHHYWVDVREYGHGQIFNLGIGEIRFSCHREISRTRPERKCGNLPAATQLDSVHRGPHIFRQAEYSVAIFGIAHPDQICIGVEQNWKRIRFTGVHTFLEKQSTDQKFQCGKFWQIRFTGVHTFFDKQSTDQMSLAWQFLAPHILIKFPIRVEQNWKRTLDRCTFPAQNGCWRILEV